MLYNVHKHIPKQTQQWQISILAIPNDCKNCKIFLYTGDLLHDEELVVPPVLGLHVCPPGGPLVL